VTLGGFSVTGGFARGDGGGLYLYATYAIVSGCRFYANEGGSIGSGVYLIANRAAFTNNWVERNTGLWIRRRGGRGGGGHTRGEPGGQQSERPSPYGTLWNSAATLVNNLLAGNAGNGLAVSSGTVRAWHTTFADNGEHAASVGSSGQLIGYLAMTNTIVAGTGVGVQVGWFGTPRKE